MRTTILINDNPYVNRVIKSSYVDLPCKRERSWQGYVTEIVCVAAFATVLAMVLTVVVASVVSAVAGLES